MKEILKCLIPLYGLERVSPRVTSLNDIKDGIVAAILMWQIICGTVVVFSLALIVG